MSIFNEVLTQAGLDEKESSVYSTLLSYGGLSVVGIANKSGQKRTNLYNILENLKHKNLVKEVKEGKTTKYFPQSPKEVETLLDRRTQMVNHAKLNYEILIGSLQSKYTLIEHKPLINSYEGLKGLQCLYDDINDTGEDVLLLRSTYDDKRKDVDDMISKQIVEQVKRNIHVKVIGPLESLEEAKLLYTKYNKARLVEERYISKYPFKLPAQILIYANKISMSTIRDEIIITIIENKDLADTYRVLFNFIWEYAAPEHHEIVKDWKQEEI